jgi:hypothetical protein
MADAAIQIDGPATRPAPVALPESALPESSSRQSGDSPSDSQPRPIDTRKHEVSAQFLLESTKCSGN